MAKQTKAPKGHPADAFDAGAIAGATAFTATILRNGRQEQATAPSLQEARIKGLGMEASAGNGKHALIHAVVKGRAILVPANYKAGAMAAQQKADPKKTADPKAAKGKAAKAGKAPKASISIDELGSSTHPIAKANKASWAAVIGKKAKADPANAFLLDDLKAKADPKAKAPKAPRAAKAGSKTEKALAMILKGGATRAAIGEACEWPSINLKAIADRRGLKLTTDKEGVITATKA